MSELTTKRDALRRSLQSLLSLIHDAQHKDFYAHIYDLTDLHNQTLNYIEANKQYWPQLYLETANFPLLYTPRFTNAFLNRAEDFYYNFRFGALGTLSSFTNMHPYKKKYKYMLKALPELSRLELKISRLDTLVNSSED